MKHRALFAAILAVCAVAPFHIGLFAESGPWPSLFRGVVVADSPSGVKVISVNPASQAYLADLRPEDIIVRVREAEVRSIDDFSVVSDALKGRTDHAQIVVFRNGSPREILLHLYSYPVLETWGVEFIPDFDLRFGDPTAGQQYWARLARGFGEVNQPQDMLNAYLNSLHNLPKDPIIALQACELFFLLGQEQLRQQAVVPAMSRLLDALSIADRLFDYPLSDADLGRLKAQLQNTLEAVRALRT